MSGLYQIAAVLAVATITSSSVVKSPGLNKTFELLILHNNDMHARFEQTSQLSGTCTTADREAGKCYGGFPRVATIVKEARLKAATGQGPPVLYLNAGDTYTGTAWFTIYKWKIAAEFINALNPDAVSLGNHEFDQGVSGLTPFIENITCPTLAANLILNKEPALYNEPKLMKSVVFDVNGTLVGVIGYLTPDTKILAIRNDVEYMEEVIAIRQEAVRLKHTGVHILIALGHSGFSKDLEIAEKVEYIDLVIGGHTNTFLWNGTSPDVEKPEGPYPTLVKQASGRLVPAVQAYAYTKYLGKLHLVFDLDGEIVSFDGNPVLLDKSVSQDPDVLSIVNRYKDGVMQISNVVVGNTSVVLDGIGCRLNECNLGNLITDAMVQKRAIMYKGNNTSGWTDAPISIIQAGGIRTSISHIKRPANITKGDLLIVLPFEGQTVMVEVNGTTIFKMLERSVENYRTNRPVAPFLQFSGLHVEYNLYNKPGLRVVKALARCGTCDIPEYSMINRTGTYRILMPSFLASGGDGYFMFEGLPITYFDYNELDSLTEYLMQHSPVHPAVEGRIVVHRPNTISGAPSLGNHEFDNGIGDLTPFIHHLTCPVLAANLVLTKVLELQQENNLKNSIVIVREGTKIGIIGYLTPETKLHTLPNDVDYMDEIVAIQEETDKLLKDGVNIIIALGHSGYIKDQQIAKEVEGLDLVIGGHSHSLLWNGTSPDSDEPIGPYPTYVTQPSGRIVPVVQAYAYTKYLGKLHVLFNSKGEITFSDGSPILLDKKIPQDPEILEILDRYRYEVDKIAGETIGETSVLLDGNICDKQECNLGNLITDAMLHYYAANYTGEQRTDVSIAFLQAGAIRASIDHAKIPVPITKADLLTVLPFKGPLATVNMSGTVLIQMLEHSVSDTDQPRVREFLQMSGLHVVYNYSKPVSERVVGAKAKCLECKQPVYHNVKPKESYKIIMPLILAQGGDGYWMLKNLPQEVLPYNEATCSIYYVQKIRNISPAVEGRIIILREISNNCSIPSLSLVMLIMAVASSILA